MYSPLELDSKQNWTLQELSLLKAAHLSPSIIYLTVLTLCGASGNGLVLLVFYRKFSSSIHRCFILTLAAFDFFACVIGTPWAIVEAFNVFTYFDKISCKVFRFFLYYFSIASSLTLVLIAVERHRKICSPLKAQLTVPLAKRALFLVAGVISSISASPALFLYGNASVRTKFANITGTKCFITDDMYETYWPAAFNVYLLILATLAAVIMGTCYFRVARRVSSLGTENVQKRMKASQKSNLSQSSLEVDEQAQQETETDSNSETASIKMTIQTKIPSSRSSPMSTRKTLDMSLKTRQWATNVIRKLSSKSGQKTLHITKMLVAVTVVFVVSCLPHLVVMLWTAIVGRDAERDPSYPKDNIYQILFYSFMINNLINPFIYGIMDLKFRRESKRILCCKYCR